MLPGSNSNILSGPNISSQKQNNTMVSILQFILIFLAIVILFGFLYTIYFRYAMQYITISGLSKSSESSELSEPSELPRTTRFTVPLFDETDINFIKQILPEETLDNIAKNISDKNYISDPNSPIQRDILLASSDNDYGRSLPWDRNVTSCDVLKNTDQDLYANIQDSLHVTMF